MADKALTDALQAYCAACYNAGCDREPIGTVAMNDAHAAVLAAAQPRGEQLYREWCAATLTADAAEDGGDDANLAVALRQFDAWIADALPANEHGQIHFGRAVAEALADAVRAHLAAQAKA